jgi:hypothetical protein
MNKLEKITPRHRNVIRIAQKWPIGPEPYVPC